MRPVPKSAFVLVVLGLPFLALWADDKSAGHGASPQTANLPERSGPQAQLKERGLEPRGRRPRHTPSGFVTAGALEFAVSKHLGRGTPLSVEHLNWACNQVIGNETVDRGQFFHHLLKGFDRYGICLESDMPYQKRFDPKLKPSDQALERANEIRGLELRIHWINPWQPKAGLTQAHLQEIKRVLATGYPVAAGSSHSRLLVGFTDDPRQPGGGRFVTKDSGASACNYMTYEFALEKVGDVFWVEVPTTPSK